MNLTPRVAAVHDLSCLGRCSLAVVLPVLSAMGAQCCPLPTALLSAHTAFPASHLATFLDFTDEMERMLLHWRELHVNFDAIYSGFLGSEAQIGVLHLLLSEFRRNETFVLIDPVMGDHGQVYRTYTPEMCQRMKELVSYADILTPNITEACILTDTPYKEKWKTQEIEAMAKKLSQQGPAKVVITGIPQKSYVANLCYETGKVPAFVKVHRVGTERSGTGDIFASIVAADAVNGVDFYTSVKKASRFIKKCILRSMELDIPTTDGVCFEEVLGTLR